MDYRGEQEQELEVLESIYPDELKVLNRNYPGVKFKVEVRLEPQLEDANGLTTEHTMCLEFELPERYPDEAPVIGIKAVETRPDEQDEEESEEEFDDHGNKVVRKLQSLPDQIHFDGFVPELSVLLEEQIDNDLLLGMQMCFTLISSVKELCETWFVEQLGKLERQHELELQAREREEQKKFRGTKVTRESFLEWRAKFRKELGIDQRDEKRRLEAHHGRMTGRTIFERGLAGDDEENEESLESAVTDKLRKL
ncbi:hypothetical protein HG536_0C01230 [Torulaspora globosa]|uniref:RWD domain-containing protein n=1 Tax=Torulaspora globosa TaxID=48254 RepID=A0A7G3ZEL9_9SACH|nr:uncharacterized protein HG536_0C01230 [Torulaspora globosa]QLL31955.1 hypothetical protein HG536_0C01230 [Torulaspora globosa]